jgi:uncharacterized protein
MRLLLIVLVVLVLLVWLKRDQRPTPPRSPPPPQRPPAQPEMLSCAHCGVYLPATEAVTDPSQRAYCCPAHRDAGPAP